MADRVHQPAAFPIRRYDNRIGNLQVSVHSNRQFLNLDNSAVARNVAWRSAMAVDICLLLVQPVCLMQHEVLR